MTEVFLASRNAKKLAEMQRILDEAMPDIRVLGLDDVAPYDEPVEDQPDFDGHALLKARAGHRALLSAEFGQPPSPGHSQVWVLSHQATTATKTRKKRITNRTPPHTTVGTRTRRARPSRSDRPAGASEPCRDGERESGMRSSSAPGQRAAPRRSSPLRSTGRVPDPAEHDPFPCDRCMWVQQVIELTGWEPLGTVVDWASIE